MKLIFAFITAVVLAGCASAPYSTKKHEYKKSPCACVELLFKEVDNG